MMSIDVKSIAILNMPSVDYHCIITGISKSEAVNLLKKNNDLSKKSGTLWNIIFSSCMKNECVLSKGR